ncbi:MAG: enoyl-CoA hydratase-related protein [Lautropia sp.]
MPPLEPRRYENIRFETDEGVASITLDRPHALNALTLGMMDEVADAMTRIEADASIRALILTGTGRGFCAGQDLRLRLPEGADMVETLMACYYRTFAAIRASRVPVVVAVNGVAAGAGFSLALAGDLPIAARSATFIQAFSRIGLAPDLGSTWILPRVLGRARALKLMMTGEPLTAVEALDWGLVVDCVDDADLMPAATTLAKRLAAGPTLAYATTRRLVDDGDGNTFGRQCRLELEANARLRETADSQEAVAAFLAKREAVFRGA